MSNFLVNILYWAMAEFRNIFTNEGQLSCADVLNLMLQNCTIIL